jgi:hypothetical protein
MNAFQLDATKMAQTTIFTHTDATPAFFGESGDDKEWWLLHGTSYDVAPWRTRHSGCHLNSV